MTLGLLLCLFVVSIILGGIYYAQGQKSKTQTDRQRLLGLCGAVYTSGLLALLIGLLFKNTWVGVGTFSVTLVADVIFVLNSTVGAGCTFFASAGTAAALMLYVAFASSFTSTGANTLGVGVHDSFTDRFEV